MLFSLKHHSRLSKIVFFGLFCVVFFVISIASAKAQGTVPLSCNGPSLVPVGKTANFSAQGGIVFSSGGYAWTTIASANPNTQLGVTSFSTIFSQPGNVNVIVEDANGAKATCRVSVSAVMSCSVSSAQVLLGESVTYDASNGIGSHTWSVTNDSSAQPSSQVGGDSFTTLYVSAGTKQVRVQDETGQAALCPAVFVTGSQRDSISCTIQTPRESRLINQNIIFQAQSATVSSDRFLWIAPSSTDPNTNPIGVQFQAKFSSPGSHTVEVIDLHTDPNVTPGRCQFEVFSVAPTPTSTVTPASTSQNFSILNPIAANSFEDLITIIADALLTLAIPILVIIIIWSGIQFLLSEGNAEKVGRARKTLLYALVGFAVILIGKGFISLIKSILELGS